MFCFSLKRISTVNNYNERLYKHFELFEFKNDNGVNFHIFPSETTKNNEAKYKKNASCFRPAGAAQGRFGSVELERNVRSQWHFYGYVSPRGVHTSVGDNGEQYQKVSRRPQVRLVHVISIAQGRTLPVRPPRVLFPSFQTGN